MQIAMSVGLIEYSATKNSLILYVKNYFLLLLTLLTLIYQVEMAWHEKLILWDVVTALQRLQCKANVRLVMFLFRLYDIYNVQAFHASKIAPSFRRRYDSPDFVACIERPFKWSDPAEVGLSV